MHERNTVLMRQDFFEIIINEFLKISGIPRPSHHEEKISAYIAGWAREHGLQAVRDEWKNVVIEKPASPGMETAPVTILQAHMDMVCVAEDGFEYDPLNDPIRVVNDDVTLTAEGTSLGADDGIGVAMCLYLLQDDTLRHGPLRVILTADEEDGMDSAEMDPVCFKGRYLINLDEEEIGALSNSCAGSELFRFQSVLRKEPVREGSLKISISVSDLLGGHSGLEIHKGRANAVVALAMVLTELSLNGIAFRITSFTGGQAYNAIPKAGSVTVVIDPEDRASAERILDNCISDFKERFCKIEPDCRFVYTTEPYEAKEAPEADASIRLARLMCSVPNGIHTMSPFVEGLVESSANLGMVSMDEGSVEFAVFARSSVEYYAGQISAICGILADAFSFELIREGSTPGWEADPDSVLVDIACGAYRELTGKEMKVRPVHAGVECGIFAKKNPGLDMISIGPTVTGVHSPAERCVLEDVKTTAELIVRILEDICRYE